MRATLRQRDLFSGRWRNVVSPTQRREVNALHIPVVAICRKIIRADVLMRHVPNGEYRDARTAAKLKAMGTLPGAADLEFHWLEATGAFIDGDNDERWPVLKRRILHLEFKIGSNKPSEAQAGYALAVQLMGDDYCVARTIDEAIVMIGERGLIRKGVEIAGRKW